MVWKESFPMLSEALRWCGRLVVYWISYGEIILSGDPCLVVMWNGEVCESEITDNTKLHYVSPTIRSWIEKYLELIKQNDGFNETCKYNVTDLDQKQDNAL